jgi:hypothetical protein
MELSFPQALELLQRAADDIRPKHDTTRDDIEIAQQQMETTNPQAAAVLGAWDQTHSMSSVDMLSAVDDGNATLMGPTANRFQTDDGCIQSNQQYKYNGR